MLSDRTLQMHHASKDKDLIKPKEFGMCNMASITRLTQFLELLRMSDIKIMSGTKIVMQ